MPPRSRLESFPAELLSGILTQCSRDDLVNLARTYHSLRTVCLKEVTNHPFAVDITSGNLKSWIVYFRQENTFLTMGPRSLYITLDVTPYDLLNAFGVFDRAVVDMEARHIHINASLILPLRSNLRKLSLKLNRTYGQRGYFDILLLILLRPLPYQCPHFEELSISTYSEYPSGEYDECIRHLTHLRKLHLDVWHLPDIPNRLSLLPASLTDLYLRTTDIQIQEEEATAVPWVRGVRKIEITKCAPQGIANLLVILSRGGATHLTGLSLRENRGNGSPAEIVSWREALTVGLQGLSFLQPPLRTMKLMGPSAWSGPLHLPLLHTAVASTLTQLSLQGVDACIFPSHLPWPRLQSLELIRILKIGYEGPLTKPIFPVLTAIIMGEIDAIQAPGDIFPVLETIDWQGPPTPEQVASLVRQDIKRINILAFYLDDALYKPLWEAIGRHTVDLIALKGYFPSWMDKLAKNGERIFPGFPNIREFTIEWC